MFQRFPKIIPLVIFCLLASCTEDMPDSPLPNQKPKTFLWLFPDSTVGVGVSRQHLRWWGEDPDGVVKGYLFAYDIFPNTVTAVPNPDTLHYSWVTANDTLILFPLDTLFRNFTVFVRAVDNTFAGLPNRGFVRMTPSPFWDKNNNGIVDADDVLLADISGAVDPVGAVQTFPVRNTPPRLEFAQDPNDPSVGLKQPDTTFTVATFAWNGFDDDGDNTLASYRIALNDTTDPSRWVTVPLRDTIVSLVVPRSWSNAADPAPGTEVIALVYGGKFLGRHLVDTIPGLRLDALNVLYVQVKDVAGEYSPMKAMPSGTNHWFVKRPRGRLLIVSDDITYGVAADTAYRRALAAVPGGEFATVGRLDIGAGLSAEDKNQGRFGRNVPPFVDPALISTFLLYDYVLWYTEAFPSLGVAQLCLFSYLQNGGRLIFSTTFLNSVDLRGALQDFAPIDSISSVDLTAPLPRLGDTRLPGDLRVVPDSSNPGSIYPPLATNHLAAGFYSVYMRPIYRRADAQYIYHLEPDPRIPLRYLGSPNIGVVDGQRTNMFIGLPLHLLNNTNPAFGNTDGLTAFFTKALLQGFRPSQRVNRRKF